MNVIDRIRKILSHYFSDLEDVVNGKTIMRSSLLAAAE